MNTHTKTHTPTCVHLRDDSLCTLLMSAAHSLTHSPKSHICIFKEQILIQASTKTLVPRKPDVWLLCSAETPLPPPKATYLWDSAIISWQLDTWGPWMSNEDHQIPLTLTIPRRSVSGFLCSGQGARHNYFSVWATSFELLQCFSCYRYD